MESQSNIITPSEIIVKGKERELTNLEQLRYFLKERQALFENRLANLTISERRPIGWQQIRADETGTEKFIETPSYGLFTGAGLCGFASGGMIEGLSPNLAGIELHALQMDTDIYAEDWDKTERRIGHPHVIVSAQDKEGEVLYIDPTYGQIDHQEAGKIMISTRDELRGRYQMTPISPTAEMADVTSGVRRTIISAIRDKRIPPKNYQALVESLR